MLDPAAQDDIHTLWDELADFDAGRSDAAMRHLQTRLSRMVGAWNSTWAGALRMVHATTADDPLKGWRIALTEVLHPFPSPDPEGPIKQLLGQWNRREMDPSFLLPMRNVGQFRTYSHRRDMPAAWFAGPVYQACWGVHGTVDAAWVGFPLNADAESHFGFYAAHVFSADEIELLAYALRGIRWFHRQLMLTHGPLIAKTPLTPAERRVLKLLLTKASEKAIAAQTRLAVSTVHQYVVSLYRRFGVRSRAELMSLWLNHRGS